MQFDHARLLAAWDAAGDTTDAAVARRLNINPSTAWRIRKGVSVPRSTTLALIESAYGVTAGELYGGRPMNYRTTAAGDAREEAVTALPLSAQGGEAA